MSPPLQVAEYNRLYQTAKAKTYKANQQVEQLDRDFAAENRELEKEEGELKRLVEKADMAASKVEDTATLKEKNSTATESLGAQEHKMVSEMTDLDKQLREDTAKQAAMKKKQLDLASQIGDAKADEKTHKRDREFLDRLSYLSQSFQGVRGRVLDLCKVKQKQYELAITVVMEGNMDAVVVDREETVRRCVEHLRDNKLPPMTFLPLDTISSKAPDERLRMIPSSKLALDVIEYDKSVEKAMWYVTGNAVVVQDLKVAKSIAYGNAGHVKCKVVTLDACVISKSGTLTGGDTTQLASKSQRWQGLGVDELRKKYEANEKDLQAVSASLYSASQTQQQLKNKHMKIKNELGNAKRLLDTSSKEVNVLGKEIDTYKRMIEQQKPKVEKLRKLVGTKKAALDQAKGAMLKISDDIYKDFCRDVGISNISEFEGTTFAQQKERNEKMMQLTSTAAKLLHKVDKGKSDLEGIGKRVDKKNEEQKKLLAETEQLRAKEAKSNDAIKIAMEEKGEVVKRRKAVKMEIEEQDAELKKIKGTLRTVFEAKEVVERLVEKEVSNAERLAAQRRTNKEACELEEIHLPKKGKPSAGGDDDGAMDVEDSENEVIRQIRKDMAADRYDYSTLGREQKHDMSEKELQRVRDSLEDERKKISDTLASMNPNMKAIEQLKDVELRLNEMQEEIKEARQKAQDVNTKFEEVKTQRCKLFNDCFEHVKERIDQTYKELTSDPTKVEHSVGGSAYLTLNNQEEPYLDGIKYDTIPPGKRFMDMTHLSGGEKTVAALGLLFAINSYSPAPFIVLDEVDAALDARNVAKVTRYIQSRRMEQQCVIISLKERFYEKADGLVGICRDMAQGHSKVFTLDLTQFEAVA